MGLMFGSIQNRTFERPLESSPTIPAYRQPNRISIRDGGARVPAGVVKVFQRSAIDDPRRHRAAVVETTKLTESQQRPIVNILHLARIIGINFDVGGNGAIEVVARAEIDSQHVFSHASDERHLGVALHPVVVLIWSEDQTFFYPSHRQDVWMRVRPLRTGPRLNRSRLGLSGRRSKATGYGRRRRSLPGCTPEARREC